MMCFIYYFISENVQKMQFLLIESKQKFKLEFTLCKLLPAEREMLRDDSAILRVLPFPATHT